MNRPAKQDAFRTVLAPTVACVVIWAGGQGQERSGTVENRQATSTRATTNLDTLRQRLTDIDRKLWQELSESERNAIDDLSQVDKAAAKEVIPVAEGALARFSPQLDEAGMLLSKLEGHWAEPILDTSLTDRYSPPMGGLADAIAGDLVVAARAGDVARASIRLDSLVQIIDAADHAGVNRRLFAVRLLAKTSACWVRAAASGLDRGAVARGEDLIRAVPSPSMIEGVVHDRGEAAVWIASLGSEGGEKEMLGKEELALFEDLTGKSFEQLKADWEDPAIRDRLKGGLNDIFEAALAVLRATPTERDAALVRYKQVKETGGWLAEMLDPAPAQLLEIDERYRRHRALCLAALAVLEEGEQALVQHKDPVSGLPFVLIPNEHGFLIGLPDAGDREHWYGHCAVTRDRE